MKLGAEPQRFRDTIASTLDACSSLEEGAQLFARRFYEAYVQSAVLVRVFATFPFSHLSDPDRGSAAEFASRLRADEPIADGTPVLTLVGTYGVAEEWRSRTLSRGHRAIPLVSEAFVAEIPMIARLLTEIGFGDLPRSTSAWQFVRREAGAAGLFFVGDARTATDARGRRIIPATDFVDEYGIATVFGFGSYARAETALSVIVFSRDTLLRSDVEPYVELRQTLCAHAARWLDTGARFTQP